MVDVTDPGPLDWRVSIVDKSGRPSPEFQRRWNTNRNNTSLIGGSITFGTGAPSGTPADGAEYIDTATTPYTFYVGKSGSWHLLSPTFAANPTAIAKDTAVNGTAPTFMRSDAAPAIQKATSSLFGIVKVDGTTITASGGIISASPPISAANPTATASDTAVNGTATTYMRSDAAPAIQKGSASQFGLFKVDGVTVNETLGVLSVPTATTSALGVVKVDGTTITISAGVISSTGGGGGGGAYIPLVTGAEPPVLVSDGDGHLITIPYTP